MGKQTRVVHDYYVGPNGNRFRPAGTLDVEYVEKKVKRGDWKKATAANLKKAAASADGE